MRSKLRAHILIAAAALPVGFTAQSALAQAGYLQTNILSDSASIAATNAPNGTPDAQLINPWGLTATATSPFWISDNGTGLSTLVNGNTGVQSASPVVTIPGPNGSAANFVAAPTGVVANTTSSFQTTAGVPAHFIFATEDGTISAWSSGSSAVLKVDNSTTGPGAVYKGLAIGSSGGNNVIYATNFRAGTIETYDSVGTTFTPVTLSGSFTVPNLPSNYSPFNISNLGGNLFVTYAVPNPATNDMDDLAGPGNGLVAEFTQDGVYEGTIGSGGTLDSPWGLAIAPANFGAFSGDLLVGNFGGGRINAFNLSNDTFAGQLADPNGNPITIHGLWGLSFGNGASAGPTNTLFFTSGPNGENDGLFGSLTAVPEPSSIGLIGAAALGLMRRRRRVNYESL
jgi:uncharacterized protein (TIGR03118 family)